MTTAAPAPGCPVDESFDPLEDPARWDQIAGQPDLIPNAVEESLRSDPSAAVWRRVTTRPVTLAGIDLPAGAACTCGSPPPAATRPPSLSRTGLTCTGPKPNATWPSARASTSASARTSVGWKRRLPSPNWPAATPASGSPRTRSSPSTPTSRSAAPRPSRSGPNSHPRRPNTPVSHPARSRFTPGPVRNQWLGLPTGSSQQGATSTGSGRPGGASSQAGRIPGRNGGVQRPHAREGRCRASVCLVLG
jgi:hypothetical protein